VYVLGISAYYHDSAAALLKEGVIVAAAQEERFTRKKHDESFPKQAVEFCLKQAGISLGDLDAIVFYDKPLLKFERLLETYMVNAPKGFRSFLKAIPLWLKQKLFFKRELYKALDEIGGYDKKTLKILFTEHHVSHAASTFFASPFPEAAVLTIDGVGEWATTTISKGEGHTLTVMK
jgi:carbamoyltransferase